MKEDVLRSMIRKQIKSSLKEAAPLSQVSTTLGRVEKMAGVKMLKKALDKGSAQQQASGLLSVVNTISGNNPQVAKLLARMLMKGSPSDPVSPEAPVAEYTAGVDDGSTVEEAKGSALQKRGDRVDKTQAMKMLKQALGTKSATDQANFVINMLKGLDLKDAAKNRMFLKMRKSLKVKD